LFSVGAKAAEPIKVGAIIPLTGPYASVGQVMIRAIDMGVDEYNAKGGLLGRKLKVIRGDSGVGSAEKVTAVGERLIAAGVNVILTGYCSQTNASIKTFGKYDIPFLTGTAYHIISDAIEEGMPETINCFDYCWDEFTYTNSLLSELFEVPKKMGWTPPNKKIAVLKIDIPYTIAPADLFIKEAKKRGYDVVIDDISQFGRIDWGTLLTKIERTKPSYIFVSLLSAQDAARFQAQFHERFGKKGLDAIIVHQYAPSSPEWLSLTGKEAAEGVIYICGAIRRNEPRVADYLKRWEAKYNERPFDVYAIQTRDGFEIWAQAVKRAGCVECYDKVVRLIRESIYEGLWGNYVFNPKDNTVLHGEYLVPLEWQQFRNGKPVLVYPDKSKEADFQKPPWIKK